MKLYITRKLDSKFIYELNKYFTVEFNNSDKKMLKEEIINNISDCEAILTQLYDPIDKDVIEAGKNLKIIANCAAGYNNIDVEYSTKKNIIVTNTPGVLTDATADIAFSLILSVSRRIIESVNYLKEGKFKGWDLQLLLGSDLTGKTLGIIGAGKIGTAVAKRSIGWDMKILYYSNNVNNEIEQKYNGTKVDLNYLLKNSDIISLHCPLTEKTYHLISINEFRKMKRSSILINTSRGQVIDEPALIEALQNGEIAGAGLDVFEKEPIVPENLLNFPNVICLPHIGSATINTRKKMVEMSIKSLIDYLVNNKKPLNLVN